MERLIEANDTAALRALEGEQNVLARQLANEAGARIRAEKRARLFGLLLALFALALPGLVCQFVEHATEETRVMLAEQREATWRAESEAADWRSAANVRAEIAKTATRCCLTVCGALDPEAP